MIVEAALEEDVDVIGLSILSGAHMELLPAILNKLKEKCMEDIVVIAGGIMPDEDRIALEKLGVKGIFGPGTPTKNISDFIRANVPDHKSTNRPM